MVNVSINFNIVAESVNIVAEFVNWISTLLLYKAYIFKEMNDLILIAFKYFCHIIQFIRL